MNAEQILSQVKHLAPSVAFSVTRSLDNPPKSGYRTYDVDIEAVVVIAGELVEAGSSLGNCEYKDGEPIGDIHGYLPQKLQEAAQNLRELVTEESINLVMPVLIQLDTVIGFLKGEMERRYEAAAIKGKLATN